MCFMLPSKYSVNKERKEYENKREIVIRLMVMSFLNENKWFAVLIHSWNEFQNFGLGLFDSEYLDQISEIKFILIILKFLFKIKLKI